MPFSRLFLLSPWLQTRQVHHELSYCICKLPVAPPTNLVGLEAPGGGLIDDLWVVIHDAQGSKVACPVHFGVMPSEGIGAPVGLHLFQGGAQQLWDLVHGFFKPVLRSHPADDVDIHSSQQLLQSLQAGFWHLVPFFKGIVPVQHHTLLLWLLFQGAGGLGLVLSLFQGRSGGCPFAGVTGLLQPLQVDTQSLPEGFFLCHLLPGSEASPALRPAPGPILPFGRMGLQGMLNLFQGFLLLMLFFKSCSFLLLHRSQCLFQGIFLLLQRSWGGSRGVCHGQGSPLLRLPGLPPGLGSSATHGLPSLVVHFFKWSLLGGHHFFKWTTPGGLVFSNLKFFQTLCGLVFSNLTRVFSNSVWAQLQLQKAKLWVVVLWLCILWLCCDYVVAICRSYHTCMCCAVVSVCVCVCIYCPTIHVLCCWTVQVCMCVCVQWHGHAWAKLAAGRIQVTNQQKQRQNFQLSGVTH